MKSIVLFFYRNDDVLLNLFFILFFTMTVLNNMDSIAIAIIFGIADAGFILYTLGRVFGFIKHFPRISVDDNNIIYRGFYGKTIFPVDRTDLIRSTSMGGIIDTMRLENNEKRKHKTIFLTDLDDKLRKRIIEIYEKQ
jgi:hypothetical protein